MAFQILFFMSYSINFKKQFLSKDEPGEEGNNYRMIISCMNGVILGEIPKRYRNKIIEEIMWGCFFNLNNLNMGSGITLRL